MQTALALSVLRHASLSWHGISTELELAAASHTEVLIDACALKWPDHITAHGLPLHWLGTEMGKTKPNQRPAFLQVCSSC